VVGALDALIGSEPADDTFASALATVPADARREALRWLAREHGAAAVPILRRCLAARPEWAVAAAEALGLLDVPEAALALEAAEAAGPAKPVRTAIRRARYRLRQRGIPRPGATPAAGPPPRAPRHRPARGWLSAVDGTGAYGLWLAVAGPYGEQALLSAVVSDEVGVLDFAAGPVSRRRLEARLAALRAESPLPWVEVPAAGVWARLVAARRQGRLPSEAAARRLDDWIVALGQPDPAAAAPDPGSSPDPGALAGSAALLTLPELAGWFLDPALVQPEAVELLQARESPLVVSAETRAERQAALVDRVIETRLDPEARQRWRGRLEHTALVLGLTGRPAEAGTARAVAAALADLDRWIGEVPFVRALVERSLAVAGDVALGRLPAGEASRAPRRPGAPPSG
jgi:hypothetical protein